MTALLSVRNTGVLKHGALSSSAKGDSIYCFGKVSAFSVGRKAICSGIDRETGGFTVGSGNTVVPLDNVHISGIPDIADVAEIVLNTRNII